MADTTDEPGAIVVPLTTTLADVREFYRWLLFNYARGTRAGYAFFLGAALALGGFSTFVLATYGESAGAIVGLCAAIAIAGYFFTILRNYLVRSPRRVFTYMHERAPVTVCVDEHAVIVTSTKGRSEHDWSAFTRRAALPTQDVLLISELSYVAIPRRDVAASDRARLERLIARVPLQATFK